MTKPNNIPELTPQRPLRSLLIKSRKIVKSSAKPPILQKADKMTSELSLANLKTVLKENNTDLTNTISKKIDSKFDALNDILSAQDKKLKF